MVDACTRHRSSERGEQWLMAMTEAGMQGSSHLGGGGYLEDHFGAFCLDVTLTFCQLMGLVLNR